MPTIAIVNNEANVRTNLGQVFKDAGYDVRQYADTEAALEL